MQLLEEDPGFPILPPDCIYQHFICQVVLLSLSVAQPAWTISNRRWCNAVSIIDIKSICIITVIIGIIICTSQPAQRKRQAAQTRQQMTRQLTNSQFAQVAYGNKYDHSGQWFNNDSQAIWMMDCTLGVSKRFILRRDFADSACTARDKGFLSTTRQAGTH